MLVDSSQALKDAAARLAGAERIFLDTEFDGYGYGARLSLIQISRGDEVFVVDAQRLTALEPLAAVLGRPEVEWILHAGSQDVPLLRKALKIGPPARIYDTQVAWGLLGVEYPVALAYLLYRILGKRSLKEFQAGDWASRPLSPEQVEYAADDVRHLPAIRDWTAEKLGARTAAVHEASAETASPEPPGPSTLDDFRNAWQLDAAGQAALRFLIDWHNALPEAEKAEAPGPRTFLALAKMLPESGAELGKIKGVPWNWVKRHGDSLAGKLAIAGMKGAKQEFVPLEPPAYSTVDEVRAEGRIRKAAAETCAALGVAPALAFPDRLVQKLVRGAALTGWRAALLGERFQKECAP